jgi:hypothetical protein
MRTEYPMEFCIVFNHDRGTYSIHQIENGSSARAAIASEKEKGRKITSSFFDATDMDAATRKAETENVNYHNVGNALEPD